MDEVVQYCAGLDVHRDTVVAAVRRPSGRGKREVETRPFLTDTKGLLTLGDWLVDQGVTRVGMESTGVYWKPVFYLLEDRVPEVWLLNAVHLKNVPGRKTDVGDAEWIAQLVEHGLVRPSFVPPPPIRELQDFTRHRRTLIEERTRGIQRLEKVLQDAGVKLSSVASTILRKSGRAILDAFELSQSGEDTEDELPRCGCGVDGGALTGENFQSDASAGEAMDSVDEVAQVATEPVEFPHQPSVTLPQRLQARGPAGDDHLSSLRPGPH